MARVRKKRAAAAVPELGERRRCIVDGALEHLFEAERDRELFIGWQNDQDLRIAFDEADQWAKRVNSKRSFLRLVADAAVPKLTSRGVMVHAVRKPEVGTDTIAVECEMISEGRFELIVDCDYELIDSLQQYASMNKGVSDECAKYVAAPVRWVPGEYDESQRWVNIPKALAGVVLN